MKCRRSLSPNANKTKLLPGKISFSYIGTNLLQNGREKTQLEFFFKLFSMRKKIFSKYKKNKEKYILRFILMPQTLKLSLI